MATSLIVEDEHGTYVGTARHPHNGYYAGDFSSRSYPRTRPTSPASASPGTRRSG